MTDEKLKKRTHLLLAWSHLADAYEFLERAVKDGCTLPDLPIMMENLNPMIDVLEIALGLAEDEDD